MEKWVNIEGFPNYKISNNGNVKSLNYNKTGIEKDLKKADNGNGYLTVLLCNKCHKRLYIHRLVAIHFIGLRKGIINHKDGNKYNNAVGNLEWVNYSENLKHAYKTKLREIPNGELGTAHVLKNEDIIEIRRLYSENELTQSQIAIKYNTTQKNISLILTRKRWKHL